MKEKNTNFLVYALLSARIDMRYPNWEIHPTSNLNSSYNESELNLN